MDIKQALGLIANRQDLTQSEMYAVMTQVMSGQCDEAQIGALLIGLKMKGESIDELLGALQVLRDFVDPITVQGDHLVDTCGTGGGAEKLFNVSTASAFVVAATGAKVAKHGNRAVSSKFGSADVLECAGVNLTTPKEVVTRAIETLGVGFLFAPNHHSVMKHVKRVRSNLGLRTLFNLLGPLSNPANVKRQVIGVFDAGLCERFAQLMHRSGSQHVLVVHSQGLDEISLSGDTLVAELKAGAIRTYTVQPELFGIARQSHQGLECSSAEESLALIKRVFAGESDSIVSKASDLIALNAGAAVYTSGLADSWKQGVEMASDVIASGAAKQKLREYIDFTCTFD